MTITYLRPELVAYDRLHEFTATAPEHTVHLTKGELTPGTYCEGVARGPWYEAKWSGMFDCIGPSHAHGQHGRLYAYFRGGEVNGIPQIMHGSPIDKFVVVP